MLYKPDVFLYDPVANLDYTIRFTSTISGELLSGFTVEDHRIQNAATRDEIAELLGGNRL